MGIKTQMQENNAQLQEHYAYIPTMPTADEARNGQYTWHKYSVVDGAKGKSIGFVVDDSETAYPMDGIHTDGFYYVLYGTPLKIVTWADGTDEEIVAMVEAADKGLINLADYWAVGQERKILLSAMPATGVGESHVQQEVTFVLMNVGGKELASPVESGRTECSFIVGMKNGLAKDKVTGEFGYINKDSTKTGGWENSDRRTWCNSVFKSSIPITLLPIFKLFNNYTCIGNGDNNIDKTEDYFSLPSEIEVFGDITNSGDGEGNQFEWHKVAQNRLRRCQDGGSAIYWWLRSPELQQSNNFQYFCCVTNIGETYTSTSGSLNLISPFGCI